MPEKTFTTSSSIIELPSFFSKFCGRTLNRRSSRNSWERITFVGFICAYTVHEALLFSEFLRLSLHMTHLAAQKITNDPNKTSHNVYTLKNSAWRLHLSVSVSKSVRALLRKWRRAMRVTVMTRHGRMCSRWGALFLFRVFLNVWVSGAGRMLQIWYCLFSVGCVLRRSSLLNSTILSLLIPLSICMVYNMRCTTYSGDGFMNGVNGFFFLVLRRIFTRSAIHFCISSVWFILL